MSFVIYGHAEERKRPHSTQFVNIWMRDRVIGDILNSQNQKESGFECLKASYDAGWEKKKSITLSKGTIDHCIFSCSAISFLQT